MNLEYHSAIICSHLTLNESKPIFDAEQNTLTRNMFPIGGEFGHKHNGRLIKNPVIDELSLVKTPFINDLQYNIWEEAKKATPNPLFRVCIDSVNLVYAICTMFYLNRVICRTYRYDFVFVYVILKYPRRLFCFHFNRTTRSCLAFGST